MRQDHYLANRSIEEAPRCKVAFDPSVPVQDDYVGLDQALQMLEEDADDDDVMIIRTMDHSSEDCDENENDRLLVEALVSYELRRKLIVKSV